MGQEIERKYRVRGDAWRAGAQGLFFRQGYLSSDPERTVRVRQVGQRGLITVKGLARGITRAEFEYEIPVADAIRLLDELCLRPLIEKTRYCLPYGGLTWEVDEFHGENAGLVIAEVELEREDQFVELPAWVGEEVSADPRYFNSSLAARPYSRWSRSSD
jgi:CYTH domain-containing protein